MRTAWMSSLWAGCRDYTIIKTLDERCDHTHTHTHIYIYIYIYIYQFQNVFLRCPTPRLHCFLSSHWPSFRFLSFMAFLIPSIQFIFRLPRALFCFGIHFNAILGNLHSAILWTWPYHVSWLCSISFIIVSSIPICCLIVTFLILSFLDILEGLLRASISVASTRILLFSVSLHVSESWWIMVGKISLLMKTLWH